MKDGLVGRSAPDFKERRLFNDSRTETIIDSTARDEVLDHGLDDGARRNGMDEELVEVRSNGEELLGRLIG